MAVQVVGQLAQMTALADITAGFALDATVHLYQNDITPTVTTLKADLTEANFTGYAASAAVTWSTPFLNESGVAQVTGDSVTFRATGTTVGNTVFGAYLLSAAVGTPLITSWRFDAPKTFASPTDAKVVVPVLTQGSQAG